MEENKNIIKEGVLVKHAKPMTKKEIDELYVYESAV